MGTYNRYEDLPLKLYRPNREGIQYIARRFLPRGGDIRSLLEVEVKHNERIDLISHRTVGDATLWWRIADVNDVMEASELEEMGRSLKIPSTYDVNPDLLNLD